MAQTTDLNVAPYYDDFDKSKNYKRVLFRPGFAIQARELTQLQSALQHQVEAHGSHIFEEGAMVIPGQIGYDSLYHAIELEDTFLGIPISEYLDKLVGKTIRGEISGVEATVVNHITATQSERGHNTLYVKYENSGTNNTEVKLTAGETISVLTNLSGTSTTVSAVVNTCHTGAAAYIGAGVYYINGFHVNVDEQTLISILASTGDVDTYRGSWRENY